MDAAEVHFMVVKLKTLERENQALERENQTLERENQSLRVECEKSKAVLETTEQRLRLANIKIRTHENKTEEPSKLQKSGNKRKLMDSSETREVILLKKYEKIIDKKNIEIAHLNKKAENGPASWKSVSDGIDALDKYVKDTDDKYNTYTVLWDFFMEKFSDFTQYIDLFEKNHSIVECSGALELYRAKFSVATEFRNKTEKLLSIQKKSEDWLQRELKLIGIYSKELKKNHLNENPGPFDDIIRCPLTRDIMIDPVILEGSGHTYERESILTWIRGCNVPTCPLSRDEISGHVTSNIAVRKLIDSHMVQLEKDFPSVLPENASDSKNSIPDNSGMQLQCPRFSGTLINYNSYSDSSVSSGEE